MTRAEFDGGWKTLQGVGWPGGENRNPEVYFGALGDLDARQWARAVAAAIDGCEFFPVPKALRELSGNSGSLGEAVAAYEAVLASGQYTAEGGTHWNFRTVAERCGKAAAEAFMEAGGDHAFASTWAEDKRRERFVASYSSAARADPQTRLLPPGAEQKTLPPAPTQFPSPLALVRKIAKLAGEELAPEERPARGVVVATDERLAELRKQAEAIVAQTGAQEAEAALCAEAEP